MVSSWRSWEAMVSLQCHLLHNFILVSNGSQLGLRVGNYACGCDFEMWKRGVECDAVYTIILDMEMYKMLTTYLEILASTIIMNSVFPSPLDLGGRHICLLPFGNSNHASASVRKLG